MLQVFNNISAKSRFSLIFTASGELNTDSGTRLLSPVTQISVTITKYQRHSASRVEKFWLKVFNLWLAGPLPSHPDEIRRLPTKAHLSQVPSPKTVMNH